MIPIIAPTYLMASRSFFYGSFLFQNLNHLELERSIRK